MRVTEMALFGNKLATWQRTGARVLLVSETCWAELLFHCAIESVAIRTAQTVVSCSIAEDPRCVEYGLPAGSEPLGLSQCSHWPLWTVLLESEGTLRNYPRVPAQVHMG